MFNAENYRVKYFTILRVCFGFYEVYNLPIKFSIQKFSKWYYLLYNNHEVNVI